MGALMLPPIPRLRRTDGWRDVAIEAREEPLVRVSDIGGGVRDDAQYHRLGFPGALSDSWLREGAAERLARAAASLPRGYTLVVWDGYRTIETQSALFGRYLDELVALHPDWPAEVLEEAVARYVTPPSRSPLTPPPHLTGGAVDLTLGDGDGRALDLGTVFDAFVSEAGARAAEGKPSPARDLRRLLFWTMHGQGFTAYIEEWWHFDLGDQFWGLVTGRPAYYPGADPPASRGLRG